MNTKIKKLLCMGVFLSGVVPTQSHAGIVIVANKDVTASSLTADEVRDIFLGKKVELGGNAVKPVDQQDGPLQDKFSTDVLGKTDDQLKAYWSRLIFTGKGIPPEKTGGDADVVNTVSTTPGGIGYVGDSAAVTGSVKVLLTMP